MMNLLPKEQQEELFYSNILHGVVIAFQIGFIILFLGVTTQVVLYFYLDNELKSTEVKLLQAKTETGKKEYAEQRNQVKAVNTKLKDYQTLIETTPKWSTVFNAFSKNIPPDVKITNFTADVITRKVEIQGLSPTREQVIQLYNNINGDTEFFEQINYPLENVTKPVDVNFKFTFFIKPGLLGPVVAPPPPTPVQRPLIPEE